MGKSEKPEVGDKVSWNWGGGAPGGTVAETKDHGAIEIESKRGNTIKRKADPSNPAVHIERSGNDVVKRASELTVEIKSNRGSGGTKRKAKEQDLGDIGEENEKDEVGDVDGHDEEPHTKNKQGVEVKKGGKEANKKQKREQEEESVEDEESEESEEGEEDGDENKEPEDQAKREETTDDDGTAEEDKGSKGEPNGNLKKQDTSGESRTKTTARAGTNGQKDTSPKQKGDKVSTHTRSQVQK